MVPSTDSVLTADQLEFFQREGYIYMPGFLYSDGGTIMERLIQAGDALSQRATPSGQNRTFSAVEFGMLFGQQEGLCSVDTNGESTCAGGETEIVQAFRDVALRSKLVEACAELMQLDPATQNMRILR